LILAAAAEAQGSWQGAFSELKQAMAECPEDREALQEYCRLLFEQGEPGDADKALQDLVKLEPDNASAWHNLGTVRMRLRRYGAAVEAYRRALELRPNAPATALHLGCALKEGGRQEEARQAWETVLRLDPGNRQALIELGDEQRNKAK
jgi:Flp pilus assembly protein TadD